MKIDISDNKDAIELVIVFEKSVDLDAAEKILNSSKVCYREGMDSSRGKGYFYSTGPKFFVTFQTVSEKDVFKSTHKEMDEVYEIYTPNWNIQKD